ncbi:Phage small terminase subunit [Oleispira antarctica RB-8]|uniref:Phage small terminase subunit n=1 Tax=Oleispira antarctica RB-8 TaxID=698738 RepID=R4YKZ5_OLEAN|nr:Phage small terminase subunit [Oleispira antarctica RB-8]
MTTPFQRHMKEQLAKTEKAQQVKALDAGDIKTVENTVADYGQFEVLTSSLNNDVAALANTPTGERDKLRKTFIARYLPHVEEYVKSAEVYANSVLVMVMMWLFDNRDIGSALKYAAVAIEQGQKMPQQFNRNLATFVADAVLEWADRELKKGHAIEPYFTQVFKQLEHWPVPEVVMMKYYKLAGSLALESEHYADAVMYLQIADEFGTANNPAKVTTKLNKARAELEKLQGPVSETETVTEEKTD